MSRKCIIYVAIYVLFISQAALLVGLCHSERLAGSHAAPCERCTGSAPRGLLAISRGSLAKCAGLAGTSTERLIGTK